MTPARRQWAKKNRERLKEIERRYRSRNKGVLREKARQRRTEHPEHVRAICRRSKGLPEPTRPCPDACECCGRESVFEKFALALDHDHRTGKFRGWLCHACNTGLGRLGDSREGLLAAVAYLDRANSE